MHKSVDIEILDYACLTNYVYENKLFITVFDILISDFNILKLSKSWRLCFFIITLKRPYIHKLIWFLLKFNIFVVLFASWH